MRLVSDSLLTEMPKMLLIGESEVSGSISICGDVALIGTGLEYLTAMSSRFNLTTNIAFDFGFANAT